MQACHDSGQGDTPGSLDVIVETRYMRAIFIQQSPSIVQTKILAVLLSALATYTKPNVVKLTSEYRHLEISSSQILRMCRRTDRILCPGLVVAADPSTTHH